MAKEIDHVDEFERLDHPVLNRHAPASDDAEQSDTTLNEMALLSPKGAGSAKDTLAKRAVN